MLHALIQACLTEGRWEEEWRNEKIDEIVKMTGGQLWTMDVGFDKAREEMREKSKELGDFAERFIGSKAKVGFLLPSFPFPGLPYSPSTARRPPL
jgi:DNA replication ATP-dependent helicase Dna2